MSLSNTIRAHKAALSSASRDLATVGEGVLEYTPMGFSFLYGCGEFYTEKCQPPLGVGRSLRNLTEERRICIPGNKPTMNNSAWI